MSDVKHTSEPWREIVPDSYYGKGISRIQKLLECADAEAGPECSDIEWVETKRRIVACVNACAGLPTDTLETAPGYKAAIEGFHEQRDARLAAEAQRDQLLEALKFYADEQRYMGPNQRIDVPDVYGESPSNTVYLWDVTKDHVDIARAAIAAVKGE